MAGGTHSSEGRNTGEEAGFLGSAVDARKPLRSSPDRPRDTFKLIEQYQSAFTEMSGDT